MSELTDRGRLLKARDVAELLGLEVETVRDHYQAGELPGFPLYGRKGGPVRFWESDVLAAIDSWAPETTKLQRSTQKRTGGSKTAPARGHGGSSSRDTRILRPI